MSETIKIINLGKTELFKKILVGSSMSRIELTNNQIESECSNR